MKFRETELVELNFVTASRVNSRLTTHECRDESQICNLARESHKQVKNLSFVEGSASILPQTGLGPFDIIFSSYALHLMKNKKQVFNNMINSLKAGGKITISYQDCLPPFEFNAYMLLNPENGERICNEMYQCETKTKIEHYCSSAGFQIAKHDKFCASIAFESIQSLLKWHWSVTHGALDLSLVTEERLQKYLAPYVGENGKPSLDFRGIKEESPVYRLVAVKQVTNARQGYNG